MEGAGDHGQIASATDVSVLHRDLETKQNLIYLHQQIDYVHCTYNSVLCFVWNQYESLPCSVKIMQGSRTGLENTPSKILVNSCSPRRQYKSYDLIPC